ncbi:MAG: lycopene beta-cyclase CrtY [Sphingomonadaceae bacterium]|nr:lycopene beta-cyclase CrtY [Sphingomonadaceae bacterium]MCP5390444.1 lycopene beta-cyclase CrtY [Sphingomonadaceae bacterium]MCP5393339.1 lycopene beta-cyclase CrtY [Sphingomonadaceae bacterium]
MNGRATDTRTEIAIVGGGLAGGLIALALRRQHPEMQVALVEASQMLGGNHRWSWFDNDLDTHGCDLLHGFRKTEWDGYSVRFPSYRRRLHSRYNSLASADFDAALRRELAPGTIRTGQQVVALDARSVDLVNGERISARSVIDCRGAVPSEQLTGGWQVFMGRHVRTPRPHGIEQPVIMDAAVNQHAPSGKSGAYRFVYVLPLGANELFVEDTYYADSPELDRNALSGRIDRYLDAHRLQGNILGGETGVLPVITGGDFGAYLREVGSEGVGLAGARGGFVHPLTSYTLPFAVETALAVAQDAELPGEQLAALLDARARRHWARTKFYRRLGAMLFGAAKPPERYRIFERFYRLDQGLIERFYAGRSSFADKARVLLGKPPVPLLGALGALTGKGNPLVRASEVRA